MKPGKSTEKNPNHYLDRYIRKNNLNTQDYNIETSTDFINNYLNTESKNAEQKYAEYQQSQKPKMMLLRKTKHSRPTRDL